MMRSLFSGVAGIKVHQTRMDVIGNNIANINTIGFKGSRTTFADMLSQLQSAASSATETRGGVNPRQIGLGVSVESIDLLFSDSSPQSTGKNTDLALAGNGLFYLRDGNQSYYTRNGSFLFDEQGNYVMAGTGLRVQGWNADDEGVINNNGATTNVVVPVGKTMEASETTRIDYSGNLDKESKMIKSITYTRASSATDTDVLAVVTTDDGTINGTANGVNVDGESVVAATITFRDDTTLNVTSGYYEVGKSVPITTIATIYDSLGGRHEVTILIDKDPDSAVTPTDADALATGTTVTTGTTTTTVYNNRWRAYIAPGVGEAGPASATFANSYTRSEATGNPEADGSSTTGTMDAISYLYFNSSGAYVSNGTANDRSITFEYGDGNGAATNQGVLSFTGLTQYANATTSFPTTNGNAAGVLQSVAVDNNGIITGAYTNGLVRNEAQIAVAQFSNASGLTKVGTTIYQESNNSGAANIRTVADFGLNVTASALEMSNVDLATEFSEMIITQRGFQANSKMTTVSDEMLETLVNMKR